MIVYVTAIGSGHSIKVPIEEKKKYSGVLGIIENTKISGKNYKKQDVDQETLFDLLYANTNFQVCEKCVIDSDSSLFNKSKIILDNLNSIIKKYPKVKFHFELSQGYKELAHILSLIARMKYKNTEAITFLRYDNSIIKFPNSEFSVTKDKYEVLEGFYNGTKDTQFNGKIATNKYMHTSPKHRKYIYAVIKWGREQGLINDKNYFTDFGELVLKYCK